MIMHKAYACVCNTDDPGGHLVIDPVWLNDLPLRTKIRLAVTGQRAIFVKYINCSCTIVF